MVHTTRGPGFGPSLLPIPPDSASVLKSFSIAPQFLTVLGSALTTPLPNVLSCCRLEMPNLLRVFSLCPLSLSSASQVPLDFPLLPVPSYKL